MATTAESQAGKKEGSVHVISAIALVLTLVLSLSVGIPFLATLVVGEEGVFAYMAVDNGRPWQGGFYDVFFTGGRIGGHELLLPAGDHPNPPYLFVRHGLRHVASAITTVAHLGPFDGWSLKTKSVVARLPFFLQYGVSFLSLAVLGSYAVRRSVVAALPIFFVILWLGSMPLLVGGAVSPMFDGNVGVFLYAVAALCLLGATRSKNRRAHQVLLVGAGFAAALGKTEWGLTFIAAIGGAVALRWIWFRFSNEPSSLSGEQVFEPVALLAGLIAGSIANWATGPGEFVGGIRLILQVVNSTQQASYVEVLWERWPWIWPLFILAPFSLMLLLVNARRLAGRDFPMLVLGLWGFATFFAFLLSRWIGNGFPRYFGPAAFALGAFAVAMLRYQLPRFVGPAITIGAAFLIAANLFHLTEKYRAGVSIAEMPGLILAGREQQYREAYKKFLATGEPQLGDVAMAYLFPDMDMTTGVASLEWLRGALAKRKKQGW